MTVKRKKWFEFVKKIMRVFIKKTEFTYIGGEITEPTIIISNHASTSAPLAWELYSGVSFRFWGAHEMNEGLVNLYKYQTKVYYHEKKHWNLFLARLFCLIASPLTNMFYKGLNLISTYKDSRLKKTIRESVETLNNGQNVILFPEDSTKGYLDQLEGLHDGFLLLADVCKKRGMDLPIRASYYRKSEKRYVVGEKIMLSELLGRGLSREEISREMLDRINELYQLSDEEIEKRNNSLSRAA